jgi:hypothetical protein
VSERERERRIGANQAIFREVNERLEKVNQAFSAMTQSMEIMCECGDMSCAQMISIPLADYERIRRDAALFAVLPGHGAPEVDSVVERHAGYEVVRKHPGEPERVAEATDPRGD